MEHYIFHHPTTGQLLMVGSGPPGALALQTAPLVDGDPAPAFTVPTAANYKTDIVDMTADPDENGRRPVIHNPLWNEP